ncbi:MAG: cytochrome c3 family protein [Gemmatimonadetes bacterium]|nr:cytochrome c3 family protein [Gemmatimonadota bacterium]MCY3942740.1 cytochrome c3 family protein [Gemmatimonadota bacterium]
MPTPQTRRLWLALSAGTFALLLVAVTVGFRRPPVETPVAQLAQLGELDPTSQPIQFPHDTHAGQFTMSCQYCHFSAERSVDAGIPPVSLCMGCHLEGIVGGRTEQAQAEIGKVRSYYAAGTPIPWKRIYKVRDHVRFPHMRHVAAGVTCQTCHGEVQEMGVLEVVAPEAGDLRMGWCVSCHLERGASRDCTVCHY